MKLNNTIKVISGIQKVLQNSAQNLLCYSQNCIEDVATKGKYVSREEFEVLQKRIDALEEKLKQK